MSTRRNNSQHPSLTMLVALLLWASNPIPCIGFPVSSQAYLGYSVQRDSSAGFGGVGGSSIGASVETSALTWLSMGLATRADGGHWGDDQSFHRVEVGPTILAEIVEDLTLRISISRFTQSVRGPPTTPKVARSKGMGWGVGLERAWQVNRRVELFWGGAFTGYRDSSEFLGSIGVSTRANAQYTGSAQTLFLGLRFAEP